MANVCGHTKASQRQKFDKGFREVAVIWMRDSFSEFLEQERLLGVSPRLCRSIPVVPLLAETCFGTRLGVDANTTSQNARKETRGRIALSHSRAP